MFKFQLSGSESDGLCLVKLLDKALHHIVTTKGKEALVKMRCIICFVRAHLEYAIHRGLDTLQHIRCKTSGGPSGSVVS
jgi:hypothetical protein